MLPVRSLCDVVPIAADTVQSVRGADVTGSSSGPPSNISHRWLYGRWPDTAEGFEKRFAEFSVVDEVDNDVVGRAEDGQSQLNKDEPTGRFGTARIASHFLQE